MFVNEKEKQMRYVLTVYAELEAKFRSLVTHARLAATLPEYLPRVDGADDELTHPPERIEFERVYDETLDATTCHFLREELKALYARWVYDKNGAWRSDFGWSSERNLNRFAGSLEQLLDEDEVTRAKRHLNAHWAYSHGLRRYGLTTEELCAQVDRSMVQVIFSE